MKKILLLPVCCLLGLAACGREQVTRHEVFEGEFFSAPVPAGYLPIRENKDFIAKALAGAGAPKQAIEMILTAPAGAYFNPGSMAMVSYSGRRADKPCAEMDAALKAVSKGAGVKVKLGETEWLLLAREKERVLEYYNCSGGAVAGAVYADPAGTVKDMRAFAAQTLAGFRRK